MPDEIIASLRDEHVIEGTVHISEDWYTFARITPDGGDRWSGDDLPCMLEDLGLDGKRVRIIIEVDDPAPS